MAQATSVPILTLDDLESRVTLTIEETAHSSVSVALLPTKRHVEGRSPRGVSAAGWWFPFLRCRSGFTPRSKRSANAGAYPQTRPHH
jgi:hypothetical protein